MLQLNYVPVSIKELTRTERARLALKGEEFGAILTDGVLKVNKDLKKPKRLEKIVRQMFAVDRPLEGEDADLFDALYEEVKTTWSDELFMQIDYAWRTTLTKKQDAEDKRNAAAWLEQNSMPDTIDEIYRLIPDTRSGLIRALYAADSLDAVFAYAFQMGAQYGKEATV